MCVRTVEEGFIKGSRLEMDLESIYIKKAKIKGIYVCGIVLVGQLEVCIKNLGGRRVDQR